MALANGVSFTARTGGTGIFNFGLSRPSFLTLTQAVTLGELVDGQTVSYLAQNSLQSPTQREWGYGTFMAAGSGAVARTTVLGTVDSNAGTSGSGTPLNFDAAPVVSLTLLSQDVVAPFTRTRLTSTLYVYLSPTGSDVTGNGTQAKPFATPQFAYNWVMANIDPAGWSVIIQFMDGTYICPSNINYINTTDDSITSLNPTGTGQSTLANWNGILYFQGNPNDRTSVVINNPTADSNFFALGEGDGWGSSVYVQHFHLKNFFSGLVLESNGVCFIADIHFDHVAHQHIQVTWMGIVDTFGTLEITGNFANHVKQGPFSLFLYSDATDLLINGNPACTSNFIQVQGGNMQFLPNSITGTCTGNQYSVFQGATAVFSPTPPGTVTGTISAGSTVNDLGVQNFNSTKTDTLTTIARTVANLPSASFVGAGARAFVTNATMSLSAGLGSIVAGVGTNKVPVYSDGTNWLIG